MSFVGKKFPDIELKSIDFKGKKMNLNFSSLGKKALLFWWPKDFTIVCPTELYAFQSKLKDFENRGVSVYGASCDTIEVHYAWLNTPKEHGGIKGITYPIVSDSRKILSWELDILDYDSHLDDETRDSLLKSGNLRDGDCVTYRTTYLLDEKGIIYHESVNDMPLGRNVDELLRLVDSKIHVEEHGEVCPANWQKGEKSMQNSLDKEKIGDFLKDNC